MKKTPGFPPDAADLSTFTVSLPAPGVKRPAWVKHAGWAEGDALYAEAARLGASWRKRENKKPFRMLAVVDINHLSELD